MRVGEWRKPQISKKIFPGAFLQPAIISESSNQFLYSTAFTAFTVFSTFGKIA
jgi:hypothetical protein